ncbi:hypothetical protein DBV15_08713 [Temnothorax longispinosus]|uniref:Uncharacterized protein n=1 Tax=Temnothorax longispinosus TaxID=300112 RepID=A0A4S2L533_9HYME|nr:hypothetical protein DBV15_08713 [Temnothorax longispinosus]
MNPKTGFSATNVKNDVTRTVLIERKLLTSINFALFKRNMSDNNWSNWYTYYLNCQFECAQIIAQQCANAHKQKLAHVAEMSSTKMEELLTLVGEDLKKQNCIRKPIPPAQRLALTLRFNDINALSVLGWRNNSKQHH